MAATKRFHVDVHYRDTTGQWYRIYTETHDEDNQPYESPLVVHQRTYGWRKAPDNLFTFTVDAIEEVLEYVSKEAQYSWVAPAE